MFYCRLFISLSDLTYMKYIYIVLIHLICHNNCNVTYVSFYLQINFEAITSNPCDLADGCLYGPYCGRRMLRIDLELSSQTRSGVLFNVGDSQSNNGYGMYIDVYSLSCYVRNTYEV